jgi:hypothetical protein
MRMLQAEGPDMDRDYPSAYSSDFFVAWEKFASEIQRAFNAAADDVGLNPLSMQQVRYSVAIIRVAELLKAVGQKEISDHFYVLAEAMNDLVDGVPHPLFKAGSPSGKRGRKPDTGAVWRIRASVCVGIELLKVGGMDEDDAIKQTAKIHKKDLSRLLRPNADLNSSIKTWLKSFANDEIRNEVALSSYKRAMAPLPFLPLRFSGDQIRHAGEQWIKSAADWTSSLVKI